MKRKLLGGLIVAPAMVVALAACGSSSNDIATNTSVPAESSQSVTSSVVTPDPSGAESPNGSTADAPAPPPVATVSPTDPCAGMFDGWNTAEDSTAPLLVKGDITSIDVGSHECFDRVVVRVDTSEAVGFHARYVPVVSHEGSGAPVPVEGAATLEVVIDASVPMAGAGQLVAFDTTPRYDLVREVKSAGSFEGQTKLAIGVSQKVAFGVYHLPSPDGTQRVVIDFARQ